MFLTDDLSFEDREAFINAARDRAEIVAKYDKVSHIKFVIIVFGIRFLVLKPLVCLRFLFARTLIYSFL